jgi:hypothetical protein
MADTIRTAQYFKMDVPNKPGEAARALGVLRDAGVSLLAFSGFPRGRRAQLDFVVPDPASFKSAAKQADLRSKGPKTCFIVYGEDRLGAVAGIVANLAEHNINVTALDAVCAGEGRYGALFWVNPRDVKKAMKALGVS